ncbi:hypothetical protein [Anatilimnocola floriformis]|uniref:hypothetical protein n=1 Tax=Anatilimnocola floriformis TaxID=2948575 RepID=UPI0020C47B91|nr:hypothetical protein [Anatilimnocola floriformis]
MKFAAFRTCAALALLFIGSAVAVAFEAIPSAEQRLLADARDGELQQFEFMEAALIAGGLQDSAAREAVLRERELKYQSLDLAVIARLPRDQRPAALLEGMHQQILTGSFQPTATLVQQTFATGDFNCVTATIIYHDLCERVGVNAEIIAQSGHVCSRLITSREEIETTRADWFTNPELRQSEQPRHAISAVALVGRIYYNRALAKLEQKEFAAAIELLEKSLACDARDRDAQENLLAGLNNWALSLCEQGEYATAARRITTGLALKADYQPLLSNDLHVHQQWVAQLCREQNFEQALQLLDAGKSRRPTAPLFVSGQRAVYTAWLKSCNEQGDTAAAAKVLRRAQEQLGAQVKLTVEARPMPKVISAKGRSERP